MNDSFISNNSIVDIKNYNFMKYKTEQSTRKNLIIFSIINIIILLTINICLIIFYYKRYGKIYKYHQSTYYKINNIYMEVIDNTTKNKYNYFNIFNYCIQIIILLYLILMLIYKFHNIVVIIIISMIISFINLNTIFNIFQILYYYYYININNNDLKIDFNYIEKLIKKQNIPIIILIKGILLSIILFKINYEIIIFNKYKSLLVLLFIKHIKNHISNVFIDQKNNIEE